MKIAWYSCEQVGRQFMAGYTIARLGADLAISQGDTPYVNKSGTWYDIAVTAHAVGDSVADLFKHHQITQITPGHRHLHQNVRRNWYMADDHEWGGNNWDHTVANANDQTSLGASDQADVDAAFWVGMQAYQQQVSEFFDNPENTDPEAEAQKPSNAAAGTAESQYPVTYFRQRFDLSGDPDETGPVECFVIDCITHRDPLQTRATTDLTMLGSVQLAWLKARLAASTATWKLIFSTKATYWPGTGGNEDSWAYYTTERDDIFSHISSNGITGVLWCCGDKHYPHVIKTETHSAIVACPISVDTNTALVAGNEAEVVWTKDAQVFGWLDISAEHIDVSMREAITGSILWSGQVAAGSNALTYPATRTA